MAHKDQYLQLADVARANGVKGASVRSWLKRNKLNRSPLVLKKKAGKVPRIFLHMNVAERYAQGRAASRPKGYKGLKGVLAELQLERNSTATDKLLKGLRVELYRHTAYIHPEDIHLLKKRMLERKVPLGYLPVAESAESVGRTRQSLSIWASAREIEFFYEHSKAYIKEKDFERYKRFVKGGKRVESVKYTALRPAISEMYLAGLNISQICSFLKIRRRTLEVRVNEWGLREQREKQQMELAEKIKAKYKI